MVCTEHVIQFNQRHLDIFMIWWTRGCNYCLLDLLMKFYLFIFHFAIFLLLDFCTTHYDNYWLKYTIDLS